MAGRQGVLLGLLAAVAVISAGSLIPTAMAQTVPLPTPAPHPKERGVAPAPAGSTAAVTNPIGSVTTSQNWGYFYPENQTPSFTPDKDGAYQLQLQANLVFADRAYPMDSKSSTSVLNLTVGGGAGGCSSTGAGFAPIAGLALGLGLLLRRKRS